MSGNTVWPQTSGFQKLAKMEHFWHFPLTFVHSKCKRSSLRSQCWMILFLWFSNTVMRWCLCGLRFSVIDYTKHTAAAAAHTHHIHRCTCTLFSCHIRFRPLHIDCSTGVNWIRSLNKNWEQVFLYYERSTTRVVGWLQPRASSFQVDWHLAAK